MLSRKKRSKAPKFAIGENVKVLKEEKITQTFDSENKLDGCLFMNQMWKYCGQEFKIKNVVKHIYYEEKLLNTKTPLYMLDGLVCDGSVDEFDHSCDRKCYLLWHENWLEKTS